MHPTGMHSCFTSICNSVHAGGGLASQHASQVTYLPPEWGLPPGGSASMGVGKTPSPGTWDTMGYSHHADSTHPTGMYSCFKHVY